MLKEKIQGCLSSLPLDRNGHVIHVTFNVFDVFSILGALLRHLWADQTFGRQHIRGEFDLDQ